jgi:hypothetical protein
MAIDFPNWADLGLDKRLSGEMRNGWDFQLMECETVRYYFNGDVFNEQVPSEDGALADPDAPLLYPAGLNLVKMLCTAQSDAAFGEYENLPVRFATRQDEQATPTHQEAINLAHKILEDSDAQKMLWELELDRNVYGGGALKITPVLHSRSHIRWSRVPRESFYPVWDPDDPDELLEVYTVVAMTSDQARARYGFEGRREIVHRIEHWTREKYESYLDGQPLMEYSGYNPWGVVPFVYTPRLRFNYWWGDSLARDIIPIQNELNLRVADIGDAIAYNAHPTRWGLNLPRDFNADNYPLGANSMWNLGRQVGDLKPEVGVLEARSAVQPGVLQHVQFLYDWARTSSFAPPIAFGEDQGGGQRSGITLEIRLWPLVKSILRSRSYLTASLRRALRISALILQQKAFSDIPERAVSCILAESIVPKYHSVLPRDQRAIVDEVIKLLSTDPPSISLETAQDLLGRGASEVSRIVAMLADDRLWGNHRNADEDRQFEEAENALREAVSTSKDQQEDTSANSEAGVSDR